MSINIQCTLTNPNSLVPIATRIFGLVNFVWISEIFINCVVDNSALYRRTRKVYTCTGVHVAKLLN